MLRNVMAVGILLVACGSEGSSSGGGDGSDDPGGAAGESSGGGGATGGTSGGSTGGSAGNSSGSGGSGGSGGDGGEGGATGGSAGTAGGGGDGGSGAGSGGAGGSGGGDPCGGTDGPEMVQLDGFCVDSTEVTNAQYERFYDAVQAGTTPEQPAACAWNDSFAPNATGVNETGEHPVRGVDWCDAYAFCAWAGKRLCGNPTGGAAVYDEPANEGESQWFAACSANGMKAFPYGDAYDAQTCNGGDYGADGVGPEPVGSIASCVGGYPGIYDMSGNVWEWEDSCNGDAGEADLCRARGGAFGNGAEFHRCDWDAFSPARNFNSGPTGIRCCSR
jgi:formylglycine-generating enzyme required for sulfatase activity